MKLFRFPFGGMEIKTLLRFIERATEIYYLCVSTGFLNPLWIVLARASAKGSSVYSGVDAVGQRNRRSPTRVSLVS